ncbi:MAG: hypothetical protein LUD72_09380 [Bacteroidales bacterium]|nr:hypothetical protein [Bacteroidales bacterium]
MNEPRFLIGFAGRKGSGKTLLANAMVEEYGGHKLSIADNLKWLACDLLQMNLKELDEAKNNNTTLNTRPTDEWYTIIGEEIGMKPYPDNLGSGTVDFPNVMDELGDIVFKDVRHLLQYIGTDLIRKWKPTWHIDKTIEKIESIPVNVPVIVDDVRYMNEKEALEEAGGQVFLVLRPGNFKVSNHISERGIGWRDFRNDNIIVNDGGIDRLLDLVKHFGDEGRFVSPSDLAVLDNCRNGYWDEWANFVEDNRFEKDMWEYVHNHHNPLMMEDIKLFVALNFDYSPKCP